MTRAALYARYSSDRQNALSVADQLAVLIRHAGAQGLQVVATFSDAAISGAAMANRPGLLGAIAAAERGEYDVLLTEDEDRIARNLEHLAHVANRLRAVGAHLSTLSTPKVETMHVAFKGLIAEDYLRALSQKTRRGMTANAERGLATGSRLYGYRSAPGGATAIVEEEAAVIRRIFADYVAGRSAREIAARLNLEHVPGPRGGAWNASSLHGSRQRGNGVLRTELYAGVKVWNRMLVVKDAMTGARIPRLRPEAEWRRTPVPQLAIVDPATWTAAAARKLRESQGRPEHQVRRKVGVFSGLMKCGQCGSSYTAMGGDRLACAGARERGPAACANTRTLSRSEVEARVLQGLKDRLLRPEVVAAYVEAYRTEFARQRGAERAERGRIAQTLGEIRRAEARTIDAIERGASTAAMEARMMERDRERIGLEARLAAIDAEEPVIELHPHAVRGYADLVERLQVQLGLNLAGDATGDRELADTVRRLVDKIVITPLLQRKGSPYDVTLHGSLAHFLTDDQGAATQPTSWGGTLVAGAQCRRAPPSGRWALAA